MAVSNQEKHWSTPYFAGAMAAFIVGAVGSVLVIVLAVVGV